MKYLIYTLLLILIVSVPLYAVNMDAIKYIESRGNPKAVSEDNARGLYQITPICLKSYNKFHEKNYDLKDLFNPSINYRVGNWYLHERIPAMLEHYSIEVNTYNILWAYNAGINRVLNGVMPTETKKYIQKYRSIVNND